MADVSAINHAGLKAFNRCYEREYRQDDPDYDAVVIQLARRSQVRAMKQKARDLSLEVDWSEVDKL